MNGKWFAALLFILVWVCVFFSIFSAAAIGVEADAKARAEGRVVLYSCPGRENVEPVVQEFERRHPGIKVQVSYGKGSQLQEKSAVKGAPDGP
jgi:ABC-type glycerol-3-phosphate transport system substrate-binding protein